MVKQKLSNGNKVVNAKPPWPAQGLNAFSIFVSYLGAKNQTN